MKELPIEEKAKRYDTAYKIAEDIHKYSSDPAETKRMEEIFPELKESDDESISKEIITYLSTVDDKELIPYESWIVWLEKQGENKNVEQDTEIRDLWEYIKEWKYKFGRLPKDEDELAACVDYIIKRQKPAWSEKDEKISKALISVLQSDFDKNTLIFDVSIGDIISWLDKKLKLLSTQNTWKPSLSQLNALSIVLKGNAPDDIVEIKSLYNELKKL